MGFRLELAKGRSAAIKAAKKHGAPATVNLDALLAEAPRDRVKWLEDRSDRRLTGKTAKALHDAATIEELHAALDKTIDRDATPDLVREGDLILQPSEERRKSGTHYTPRELTEPIVRDTLEPTLGRLRREADGSIPRPERILDLKVCDPAMGSGAFLVEACRQLGDALVDSWHAHDAVPPIPPDEDETIHARRLVARNCLYGVDRNEVAVDLAKLSLWLTTLAKDHPLTFLDHALRHGDSLVGLTIEQIEAFHWKGGEKRFQTGIETTWIAEPIRKALRLRSEIQEADDETPDRELRDRLDEADHALAHVKWNGHLALAAYFKGKKAKEREALRRQFAADLQFGAPSGSDEARLGDPDEGGPSPSRALPYIGWLEELRSAAPPLSPFHWQIEFPEVFLPDERDNPGFDAVIGNPPFAGKNTTKKGNVPGYPDWLKQIHEGSHGNSDLVAHFFRRAFNLIREAGAFGLIATNTIAQGDTRSTGLRYICSRGGEIFRARRRVKWPRQAAVIVSVVHVHRGPWHGRRLLDGTEVPKITAFLFHRGGNDDPAQLAGNAGKSFVGSYVLGMGFTFDDTDKKGVASPLAEMERLIAENPKNKEAIFPYIGGAELNVSPTHSHHRYVINFKDYPLRRNDHGAEAAPDEASSWSDASDVQREAWRRGGTVPHDYSGPVAADWPELLAIVEERVRPERERNNRKAYRDYWWHYGEKRSELQTAIAGLDRVLAISRVGQHAAFTFLPAGTVFSEGLIALPLPTNAAFCALQSRPHELWARFFGSSLKDDLRYAPSDCFETFPFPTHWETRPDLEAAGKAYYDYRAALMIERDEGLTKICNRFHDPYETGPAIQKLRDLHATMDRTVLHAYGWTDIPTNCDFLLDYEIDEETWGARKKPYRYRWPDEIRDEVLVRLLELNARRAAAEQSQGRGR